METRPCTHTCPPLTALQCDVPPYPAPPTTSSCPPLGAPPTDTLHEHAFLRVAALLSVRGFVPNFPSPFLLRLEENPQIRKKAMVKLGRCLCIGRWLRYSRVDQGSTVIRSPLKRVLRAYAPLTFDHSMESPGYPALTPRRKTRKQARSNGEPRAVSMYRKMTLAKPG